MCMTLGQHCLAPVTETAGSPSSMQIKATHVCCCMITVCLSGTCCKSPSSAGVLCALQSACMAPFAAASQAGRRRREAADWDGKRSHCKGERRACFTSASHANEIKQCRCFAHARLGTTLFNDVLTACGRCRYHNAYFCPKMSLTCGAEIDQGSVNRHIAALAGSMVALRQCTLP